MTDPFNPDAEPAPEYEPGQGDPGPVDPVGPDVMPDPTPQEVPQLTGLKNEGGAPDAVRTGGGSPGLILANPD